MNLHIIKRFAAYAKGQGIEIHRDDLVWLSKLLSKTPEHVARALLHDYLAVYKSADKNKRFHANTFIREKMDEAFR